MGEALSTLGASASRQMVRATGAHSFEPTQLHSVHLGRCWQKMQGCVHVTSASCQGTACLDGSGGAAVTADRRGSATLADPREWRHWQYGQQRLNSAGNIMSCRIGPSRHDEEGRGGRPAFH